MGRNCSTDFYKDRDDRERERDRYRNMYNFAL